MSARRERLMTEDLDTPRAALRLAVDTSNIAFAPDGEPATREASEWSAPGPRTKEFNTESRRGPFGQHRASAVAATEVLPGEKLAHQMIAQHMKVLYGTAFALTRDRDNAQDLMQATIERIIRSEQQPQVTFMAWAGSIMRHLHVDSLRRGHREDVLGPEVPHPVVESPSNLADSSALTSISETALHRAILELEPDLRSVVELCYLNQKRDRDVAGMLGVPVSTVGTRLMRARRRLRELLSRDIPEL